MESSAGSMVTNVRRLLKIAPDGQIQTVAHPHDVNINGMVFDSRGRLFVMTHAGSTR